MLDIHVHVHVYIHVHREIKLILIFTILMSHNNIVRFLIGAVC